MAEDAYEVVVAGAGLVGATLALALARAGVRVAVVDAATPDAAADPRTSAVAYAAFRAWETLGLTRLRAQAQPITRIVVADAPHPGASASAAPWALAAALQFDAAELPDEDGPLGWMVENAHVRPALMQALAEAGAAVIAPARVEGVQVDGARAEIRLSGGRTLVTPLVVGAEGRRSPVREAAGIGFTGRAHRQHALVATVALERRHEGVARQLFLPDGPLAVLPLPPGDDGRDRASLVWSTSADSARALAEGSAAMFESHLARRLGDGVGAATLAGPRATFPLELRLAERMTAPRIALAGDAAQVIHPVAGQGLNLGLKDAAALAEVVVDARRLGEDWGSALVLDRYARWRRLDRLAQAAGTELFARLFSTRQPLARLARGAALAAAGASAPARRMFMREAGAALGETPRLFRGEGL